MTEEEQDALERVVDRSLAGLMEHFEVVQVFVSRYVAAGRESVTITYHKGAGNWHARYGMVKAWTLTQERDDGAVDVDDEECE